MALTRGTVAETAGSLPVRTDTGRDLAKRSARSRLRAYSSPPNPHKMPAKKNRETPFHFPLVPLLGVVAGRQGKHSKVVSAILSDLRQLDAHSAIKVSLEANGAKKADLRSALHRAARIRNIKLSTTSDDKNLYVFHGQPRNQRLG